MAEILAGMFTYSRGGKGFCGRRCGHGECPGMSKTEEAKALMPGGDTDL